MDNKITRSGESLTVNELMPNRSFHERALKAVAFVGFAAASLFAVEWTLDIGANQDVGYLDCAKYAAEFGAGFVLAGLSAAVLNRANSSS
jgi:hypothetical protein